ncbi:DUF6777 domain-containing protein [Streptomyces flaveus]|uniref:DUF6777 domain-containing protein n=1 Tax=Streptomyces flaveus TaxID=66370 RepID=A0A917R6F7_9ACTN|nr:DUF6777 domain-containing protein [Streptomyces flaveus]GGK92728.1 hypothetical protein GCM10010094_61970 [Streptomyces flaveus]
MSVEPPSSGRPAGPPSGPLGPSGPPSPQSPGDRAPLGPSGGGSGAGGPGGGGPSGPSGPLGPAEPGPGDGPALPWWKSAPRVAVIALVAVAAVVLAVVLTRPDGGTPGSGSEVFLQAAGKAGPDRFTESTAQDNSTVPVTPSPTTTSDSSNVTRGVDGSAPGLYGGTRNKAACDVEKQITYLQETPAKNKAFASVLGLEPSGVPGYLRSLTPVQLRMDTRVTNHGYRDGAANSYQAVLQSGTAVLVDDRGVPRVRCACGNPLTPPVAQQGTPKRTGDSWPSYRPSNVVVVSPAPQPVNSFVLYDPDNGEWIERYKGDTGAKDKKTKPPEKRPSPSESPLPPSCPPDKSPCPPTSPTKPPTETTSPDETYPDDETSPKPEPTTPEPPPDEPTDATSDPAYGSEPADSPPDTTSDPASGSEPADPPPDQGSPDTMSAPAPDSEPVPN